MTKAQYTERELQRLQLGWALRKQGGRTDDAGGTPADEHRQAIERNQERAMAQARRDLGFE